jgi:hypothetical protein
MRFSVALRRPQLDWRKSSFCASGECLELASSDDVFFVRNSTDPRKVISCNAEELAAFAKGLAAGEFADPR